jgi:hypothetical protein
VLNALPAAYLLVIENIEQGLSRLAFVLMISAHSNIAYHQALISKRN